MRPPAARYSPAIAAFAWLVLSLSYGAAAPGPQVPPRPSLLDLLDAANPAFDLRERLDECHDAALERQEAEEAASTRPREGPARADADRFLIDLQQELQRLIAEGRRDSARLRELRAQAQLEIDALFPADADVRYRACEERLGRARRDLAIARDLEACYRGALAALGLSALADRAEHALDVLRARLIDSFTCVRSETRPPLRSEITIPPGGPSLVVLETFCLDGELARPHDGQAYRVAGMADRVGRELFDLLRQAAAEPDRAADIQQAIWARPPRDRSTPASRSGAPSAGAGAVDLPDAVERGDIDVEARILGGFSSTELAIVNRTARPIIVRLTGALLNSGDAGTQGVGAAGADTSRPPAAGRRGSGEPEDPEARIEEILEQARRWLDRATERVRNGDHSPEALRELVEALRAAEGVGLDDDEMTDAWDTLEQGAFDRATSSYKVWKANPTEENRRLALDELRATEHIGLPDDPPGAPAGRNQERFDAMLKDLTRR